jgi:membrane-associated protease RseP (regulator of RpoE activity)
MKRKTLLSLTAFVLLASSVVARAQTTTPAPSVPPAPSAPSAPSAPPAPEAFATAFFDDGNFLGVHVEDVTRENAARYQLTGEPRGVGVKEVIKGSPAERAGVRAGDVILRFDGESVTSVRKLTRLIEESAPEHAAHLTVSRNGSEQEVSATLSRRDHFAPAIGGTLMPGFDAEGLKRMSEEFGARSGEWQLKGDEMRKRLEELQREHPEGMFTFGSSRRIGVTTSTLSRQLADYFGVSNGVLVNSVEANSPADKARLKAGDIITEADGTKVEDAGDLSGILNRKEEGEVTLTVVRDKKQRTLRVTPERRQPQGRLLTPGAFRVESPIAAVALPRVTIAPRVMVAPSVRVIGPRVTVAPRAIAPPRVRVVPSRIHAFSRGDAIL